MIVAEADQHSYTHVHDHDLLTHDEVKAVLSFGDGGSDGDDHEESGHRDRIGNQQERSSELSPLARVATSEQSPAAVPEAGGVTVRKWTSNKPLTAREFYAKAAGSLLVNDFEEDSTKP